jgi:cytoskeleton protein RodZ
LIDLDASFADAEPPIGHLKPNRISPSDRALISGSPAARLFYKPVSLVSSALSRGRRTIFRVARRVDFRRARQVEPVYLPPEAACPELEVEPEPSLGATLIAVREELGLTAPQVAAAIRVPLSYVEMMETGNYGAIPDQLYLLPSFRRYAEYLGLNVADVVAGFMLDFEAEENAVPIPETARATARPPLPWRRIAQAGGIVCATASIAALAVVMVHHRPAPTAAAVQVASSAPAPAEPVPMTVPEAQFAHVSSVTPVSQLVPVAPIATEPVAPVASLRHVTPAPVAPIAPAASRARVAPAPLPVASRGPFGSTALAHLAPLAPLVTLAPLAPIEPLGAASIVPVSMNPSVHHAAGLPAKSKATAKAHPSSHRVLASTAHPHHVVVRKAPHHPLTHRTPTG